MNWLHRIAELIKRDGAAARIVIVDVTGPTPRSIGTGMLVTAQHTEGKIGRGAIEREAVAAARKLIAALGSGSSHPAWLREVLEFPTGPVLGEPTGGVATLAVEAFGAPEVEAIGRQRSRGNGDDLLARRLATGSPPALLDAATAADGTWGHALTRLRTAPGLALVRATLADGTSAVVERLAQSGTPFYVYGTGLVARALVRQLAELPFDVSWVDAEPSHFPDGVPARTRLVAHDDMSEVVRQAAGGGFHAVMTASHDLDVAVCRAVLERRDFAYLGVIGSRLKRERLAERLVLDGVPADLVARVICPIGLPEIRSKQPAVIAVSIAAQALIALQSIQTGTKR